VFQHDLSRIRHAMARQESAEMHVSAEIHGQTRGRTILSYLMKPLTDQIARTFRER
jgi:hypothetical protein